MIEFEDQDTEERNWEELKRVEANKKHANLPLWPYMSYRFRVIAINDQGTSDPSNPSDIYKTPADSNGVVFLLTAEGFFHYQILYSNVILI